MPQYSLDNSNLFRTDRKNFLTVINLFINYVKKHQLIDYINKSQYLISL